MPITIAPVTLPALTTAAVDGTGTFDVLMRSMKAHLEAEYNKGRIKGPEYATVYLGSLEQVMQTSLQFLLQKDKATLEAELVQAQIALSVVQADLVRAQTLNAVEERAVLIAQKCKLQAEFDLLVVTKEKASEEKLLMLWKVNTEKAQTTALGVDDNSVVGKQKALYSAQTDGFKRDAEQKVAKIMVDTWNTRRMTDEGTVADSTNLLNDVTVGRAVTKLLTGVNA